MSLPVNTKTQPTRESDAQIVRGVGLLNKAFTILDLFSPERPAWTQAEIGREADLPRSTVSRLVRYLWECGYLSFERHSNSYTLGYSALDLGRRAEAQFDLASVARDVLEEISQRTHETVLLTRYDPSDRAVYCAYQVPSQHEGLRVFEKVGAKFPLSAGASAKAVLAALPEDVISDVLATSATSPDAGPNGHLEKLRPELGVIRERGFATSREETYPGAGGIGAAIVNAHGVPEGSIAVAAPLYRLRAEVLADFAALIVDGAHTISRRLAGDTGAAPSGRAALEPTA